MPLRPTRCLTAVALLLMLSACHGGRYFLYNVPDLRDYRKFAARPIARGNAAPFRFNDAVGRRHLRLPPHLRRPGLDRFLRRTGTVAFLVIRHDTLFIERYYHGYADSSVVPSFSVAKGVVAALVGIAVAEGYIRSVHDPIARYVPELDSARLGAVSIEHLLNMRSGVAFREDYWNPLGDVARYYYGRRLTRYVRRLRAAEAPDQRLAYQSANTQLLGMLVARATGRPLAHYAQEKLWRPLGMEYDASWSLDRPDGTEKAFCCLNARARDFAKIGRLYRRRGEWQGRQIVPREWVEESTVDSAERARNAYRDSYHWRHRVDYRPPLAGETPSDKRGMPVPIPDFFAEGILGQFVYVYPAKDIIIVRLGRRAGRTPWARLFQQLAKLN